MARTFRLGDSICSIVPRSSLLSQPSEAEARAWLRRLVRSRGDMARLRELLEAQHMPCWGATDADVLAMTARLWAAGHIVGVAEPVAERRLDDPSITDLTDLGPFEGPDTIDPHAAGPRGPFEGPDTPEPTPPRTEPTWLSVELVDEHGDPLDADYTLTLEGKPSEGRFEGGNIVRHDPIEPHTLATISLSRIAVLARPLDEPDDDDVVDPGALDPTAPRLDPATPTRITIEDEEGNPLPVAHAVLLTDGEEGDALDLPADLGILPAGPRYALRITGLSTTPR